MVVVIAIWIVTVRALNVRFLALTAPSGEKAESAEGEAKEATAAVVA